MLFTALAAVLLFLAGRAVARRAGHGPVARGLSGATVAVPYALLSLVLSLVVTSSSPRLDRFFTPFLLGPTASLSGEEQLDVDLKVHAAHVAAFLWPLAIGAVAGFLGGVATVRDELAGRRPWGSRAWSALAGGWRMLAVGLLGSFLGLQVVAFAESRATLSVAGSGGAFSAEGGLSAGADLVLGTLLALAWGLVGGAVGGLLGARSLPPGAREPVAATPTTEPGPAPPGGPWAGPHLPGTNRPPDP